MSGPTPGALLADFVLEERRRVLAAGRRLLSIPGAGPVEGGRPGGFEGAWIALGSAEDVDLPALGRQVAAALPAGAPVACVFPGAWPLAAVARRALLGTGEAGALRARREGRSSARVSLSEWRRAFGPAFSWRHVRAFGLLLPVLEREDEGPLSPRTVGVLAAVEHLIGSWPVVRALGDRILIEGVRR